MKAYINYIAAAAFGAILLPGCAADEPFGFKGEGNVKLSTNISAKVNELSRASSTDQELAESTVVWISNAKGPVRKFASLGEIPADKGIKLLADNYTAEAWAGDSVPASFDDRYFYGSKEFTVTSGSTENVEITCRIANTVVAVRYSDDIDAVLSDYSFTVGHSQGKLTFEGRDERRGYFMMNSRDHDLEWKLTGRKADGSEFTREGTITDAARATLYTINIKCTPQSEIIGGGYLTIEIDETSVEIEDEINIVAAPTVRGFDFDIAQPVRGEAGKLGRRSVWISANSSIESLVMSCPVFAEMLGLEGNDFDIFNMDAKYEPQIHAAGIVWTYNHDEAAGASTMKITFEETFTSRLTNGDYPVDIDVRDANGKTARATLTFSVNDAPLATADCSAGTVWATRATIGGVILKAGTQPLLKYRATGTQAWTDAETPAVDGDRFTSVLTGLRPGTSYEYVAATADGSFISPVVKTFTTEAEAQIPNGDFEGWSMNGKVQMLYGSGQSMFWDSGNHGSTTAPDFLGGGNITTPATSPVHGGSYSLRMESKSIFSVLAAGNAFVGEFLGTEGGTNGVLGWGRPFTSRPAKLRGWVKYNPGTVSSTSDNVPDIVKGQPDKGIVYIALLDASKGPKAGSYEGSATYPVIVKTKAPGQYFSKDDANVIAYGEKVFEGATAGDGLVEFEIPIEYFKTDVKAAYIVCTISASKGGDYFAGAGGSVMYIDDLRLIYE